MRMACSANKSQNQNAHIICYDLASHNPRPSSRSSHTTQDMDGGIAPRAPVPTAHPRHAGRALSGVGATGLTAASTVLLFICLVGRFVWVYKKEEAAASRLGPRSSPPVLRAIVVQRAVPPSLLPVFVHASDRGAPGYECCAVCLSELGERDAGRLLPGCGHGFHEACIATWLQVNTTCPLCRAAVAY